MRLRSWVAAMGAVLASVIIFAAIEGSPQAFAQAPVGSSAQPTANPARAKLVEVRVNQFSWQLLSRFDKSVVCEVVIEHDGTPNFYEALNYCSPETLKSEIDRLPTVRPGLTPRPIPPGIDENVLYQYFSWKFKESFQVTRKVIVPIPEMIVNISVPNGSVDQPYVIVSAYEPAVDNKILGLRGTINTLLTFSCATDHCKVPVQSDSTIELWAYSSFGDESKHVNATVRISGQRGAYTLTLSAQRPLTAYIDACSIVWGLPQPESISWAAMPDLPQELNTAQTLHYLTAKLITVGIVSAKDCPGDGLFSDGSPNGCGMDTARPTVNQWQNQFDPVIWLSARSSGIPARLLKTLIKVETQFWPGTGDNTLAEYGLTQLNYLGVDTALRWDSELFKQVCNNSLYDCSRGYAGLPPDVQTQLKGALMNLVNSSCVNCPGGINLASAQQSIPMLAQALRANCKQTQYILGDQALKPANYDDMWHFTLVSYHSGYQCLYDALATTQKGLQNLDWLHVSANLKCKDAKSYVDNFWDELTGFTPVISPAQANVTFSLPVMTTPTPVPSPTPYMSKANLHIQVYLDKNGDGKPAVDEMVDGLIALITYSDGPAVTQVVNQGDVSIALSSHRVGAHVTVSIKNLFFFFETSIPASGEVPVTVRLTQPVLPPALP